MNRSTIKRIESLEQQVRLDTGKYHVLLVSSDEEEDQETAALKASPKSTKGDKLIVIPLVGPREGRNSPKETASGGLSS